MIKINYINRKLMAGITAFTIMSTSLTGCANDIQYDKFYYEEDSNGQLVCINEIDGDYINNYYVIFLKVFDEEKIYIALKGRYNPFIGYRRQAGLALSPNETTYYDVFNNEIIFCSENTNENITILSETKLFDFLLYYGCEKQSYSEEDLKELLEKIKTDFVYDNESKKLVKSK